MDKQITQFKEDMCKLRTAIENYFISLLKDNGLEELECNIFMDSPTVIDCGINWSSFTLDRILLFQRTDGTSFIKFDASNEDYSDDVHFDDVSTELLIGIYEWVNANEEELLDFDEE